MGIKYTKSKKNGWVVRMCIKGRRRSKFFRTKQGAISYQQEMERRHALGEDVILIDNSAISLRLKDVAEDWLKCKKGILRPSTLERYRQVLDRYLLPALGNLAVNQISRNLVITFVKRLNCHPCRKVYLMKKTKIKREVDIGKTLSKSTVQNILKPLSSILEEAVDRGVISNNPALRLGKYFEKSTSSRRVEYTPLSYGDITRLLDTAKTFGYEWHSLIFLAIHTGMRLGEIASLKWSDISLGETPDQKKRTIHVQRSYRKGVQGTTKSGKCRFVEYDKGLWSVLVEWHRQWVEQKIKNGWAEDMELVFPNECGGFIDPDNFRQRIFKECLRRGQLRDIRLHDLRHQYASMCLSKSKPITFLSKQLGHASPRITLEFYAHYMPSIDQPDLEDIFAA